MLADDERYCGIAGAAIPLTWAEGITAMVPDDEFEEAIEPQLPIVDPHHHFMDRPTKTYVFDDYCKDITASGHNIIASVHIECVSMYKAPGRELMRPAGETEWVNGLAAPRSEEHTSELQ